MSASALAWTACISSAFCGGAFAWMAGIALCTQRGRAALRKRATLGVRREEHLSVKGYAAWCINRACEKSRAGSLKLPVWAFVCSDALLEVAVPAGLRYRVTRDGLVSARLELAAFGIVAGVCSGAVFSFELALLMGCAGGIWGWTSMKRSLIAERNTRRRALESHLSQALEVICLGLRSGLSFERALDRYCSCFKTPLAQQLAIAHEEWASGLRRREEALREVQESYDSSMLQRAIDSIIRSLRFGSPLADTLDALAAESRTVHKAAVEEQVMKAPVKMMVPVGVLILPSMLLLVIGPVLLDLLM